MNIDRELELLKKIEALHIEKDRLTKRMKKLEGVVDDLKTLQAYMQNSTNPYDIPIRETELECLLEELEKG